MAYEIWLSFNNEEEKFQIPVNPSSIEVKDGSKGNTYDVMGLGDINVIKGRTLTEYSFSSFFPGNRWKEILEKQNTPGTKPSFLAASDLLSPVTKEEETKGYVNYILGWMDKKRPIRFKYLGGAFEINEAVSIESFDWKEVAGATGDVEYSIKLKKYLFYQAKKATVVPDQDNPEGSTVQTESAERPDERETPATYTLVAGDSLWIVAKRLLGDGGRWPEIQKLNGIQDAEIKRLPIGKVLKIPGVK